MISKDEKNKNPKIGRPVKTEQGLQFKKEYLTNEMKFQLQCELLVTIHEKYFIEPPSDPTNKRVVIAWITNLFEMHECTQLYETLLNLNEFYYKNSSVFPQDRLKYTSLIDISYMIHQIKLKHGEKLKSVQLVLTVIFFLYNQKLINQKFHDYISQQIDNICSQMIKGTTHGLNKIDVLIINLILQICVKEGIKIKK